jgi:hypothetical protein
MPEEVARSILLAGGECGEDVPCVASLVRTLLGEDAAHYAPPGVPLGRTLLFESSGRWSIVVPRGLPLRRMSFEVAHALVEWWLREREPRSFKDAEVTTTRAASALVCPAQPFRRAMLRLGRSLPDLAEAYGTTETLVALREAELLGLRRAVVTPDHVRAHVPSGWSLPPEPVLREWAERGAPGIRRVRLRDDADRVVVDVAV